MTEIIEVTDEHIVNGKKKCPGSCPIARALEPVLTQKGHRGILVRELFTEAGCYAEEGQQANPIVLRHGPKLRRWIENYDHYYRFHNPFKLILDYTNETIEVCS